MTCIEIASETITTRKGDRETATTAYAQLTDEGWVWYTEARQTVYGPGGEILSESSLGADMPEAWIGEAPTVESLTHELRGALGEGA